MGRILARLPVAAAVMVVALGIATLALTLPSPLDAERRTMLVFALVVGWGFCGSGLWMLLSGDATRLGLLSAATGCTLFVLCWRLSEVPLAYTAGMLFGAVWLPLLGHIVLAFPSGRLRSRTDRWLLGCGYAVALVLQPLPLLFWAGDVPLVCEKCPRNL